VTEPILRGQFADEGHSLGPNDDEISLLDFVNIILRYRFWIIAVAILGGLIAVLPVAFSKPTYTATASFSLQGAESRPSGLASLAGQLGVPVSLSGAASSSPQFYVDLIKTRAVLSFIVDDTFKVAGKAGRPLSFYELFEVAGDSKAMKRDNSFRLLSRSIISASIAKATGVVTVSVTSPWQSVSLSIADRVLDAVNTFSLRTRQAQAGAERRFSEERLGPARLSLRSAEDRLESFLRSNRTYRESPELLFEYDRLQRDVAMQQQVYTSVAQGYEEARMSEVRDTPLITIIDSAAVSASPDPRGRIRRTVVGMIIGALLGLIGVFARELFARRRAMMDPDVETFSELIGELRADLTRWVPGRRPHKPHSDE